MEHHHIFAYMGAGGDKEKMGMELWPATKRGPTTVNMQMKDGNLDLVHWVEDGSSIPIIPVEKTVAWRPGGAQFTYIGFNDFKERPFALAFNEPRLFEAVALILSATANYEDSTNTPLFSAERLWLEEVNGLSILRIKLLNAATIAIHLDHDTAKRLKEIIENL